MKRYIVYKNPVLLLIAVLLSGLLGWVVSCQHAQPTQLDGTLTLKALISDDSGTLPKNERLGYAPVTAARVSLESKNYFSSSSTPVYYYGVTDSLGWVEFNNLPVAEYKLFASKKITVPDPETGLMKNLTLNGSTIIELTQPNLVADTVKTYPFTEAPVVINEIYYVGPRNNAFYFYDQFIELYNTTDSTVYLDGMILCRGRQARPPDIDSVDYVQVLYVYQFPGEPVTGREYPLESHQFTVIAQDAVNHSAYINGAIDLSGAQWEFYNPYAADIDTAAQNVVNQIPENSTDFMINLVHNAVILADGSRFYPGEVSPTGYQYIHVPLSTVLDGVEYSSNSSKQKELTLRVDAGFAGVGVSKYSGISVERRFPGTDTNNSSLDFVNINHPTPGYQH